MAAQRRSVELENIEYSVDAVLLCSPTGSVLESPLCSPSPPSHQRLHPSQNGISGTPHHPVHHQTNTTPIGSRFCQMLSSSSSFSSTVNNSSSFSFYPRRSCISSVQCNPDLFRSSSDPGPAEGGWRPVMPGYAPPPDAEFPREGSGWEGVEEEQEFPDFDGPDDGLRQTIPIMPRFLAVVCFVLNVLGPGLGLNVIYRASVQSKSYIVIYCHTPSLCNCNP